MTRRIRHSAVAWLVPALLIALSLVPSIMGMVRLRALTSGTAPSVSNVRFFEAPLPVTLHILAVVPFSILGALQFVPQLRQRNRWHRMSGRLVVVAGIAAAVTGLWMTLAYPWPEGDGVALYLLRLVFGSAMAVSLLFAVDAVRRRDFRSHGTWMIRAYAIGMGAGTQVFTHLPWFFLVGKPDESMRALLMGAGWLINVVIAEIVVRRDSIRGRTSLTLEAR